MGMCCRWISADGLSKREQISVRREHQQLALAVRLVGRTVHVAFGQGVELWFQFRVELINVANVNVIRESAGAGRRGVLAGLLPDAEARGFAVHISVVGVAHECFEAQDVGEEIHSAIDVFDDHEWRDLDEIGHGCSPAGRLAYLARMSAVAAPNSKTKSEAKAPA